jgi:hypothetical protein
MKTNKRTNKTTAVKTSTKRESVSTLLVDVHINANPDGLNTPTHETRNIGRYSGMGIGRFQNWVLLQCATEPHTCDDIGRLWEREHPIASAYQRDGGAVHYVKHNVRGDYNHGKHGQHGKPPVDANGRWNPTPIWDTNGNPTYPKYPAKWMGADGKPNGVGPLPDGVNVTA